MPDSCMTTGTRLTLMPECRCRTFFLAFRHQGHALGRALGIHFTTTQYGRAGCIPFHCQQYGRAECIPFHRQQHGCALVEGLGLLVWLTCSQLQAFQDRGQQS